MNSMLLVNFSHPLTRGQLEQVESLAGEPATRVIDAPVEFDHSEPFQEQVRALVDSISLSPEEWQTLPLIISPPSLSMAAVTILAELHGRIGYFPAYIRLRPVVGSSPPHFEVAEIINLQAMRDEARCRR